MNPFSWVEPSDVPAALEAGARKGALYKAGGIDVLDRLKEHLDEPVQLVNLRRLSQLDFLKAEDHALQIGPLVTLARLAADATVLQEARALAQAAEGAATPQIRNAATLGGNLAQRPRCWYFRSELFACAKKGGDTCFAQEGEHQFHAIFDNGSCAAVAPSGTATALVALGARLKLRSQGGDRTLPIEEFFVPAEEDFRRENRLLPGELITSIEVPKAARSAYGKLMQKQSFDWPLVEVAVALELDGRIVRSARVALGAVAHTPRRALKTEQWLAGRPLDEATLRNAARLATHGATPLERNGYKLPLVETLVRRTLEAAAQEES